MSDYVSEDKISLILSRLPVKTLLQLRCVCKVWRKVIDSPSFIQEHLSLQKRCFLLQDPRNYMQKGSPECSVLDPHALPSVHLLHGLSGDDGYLFVGTHNGIVCLFNYSSRKSFMLWNPSIRKLFTVPIPAYKDSGWKFYENGHCFGFWTDPATKEFKFIIPGVKVRGKSTSCVLYSSIRKDWRVIRGVHVGIWESRPIVMIGRVAYWRGFRSEDDDAGIILSFDFVLERFDHFEMPDLKFSLDEPIHCDWQGNLSVLVRGRKSSDRYNLYVRQEGAWVNMFGFDVIPRIKKVFWMLGEEERVRVLAENCCELVWYDTKDGIIRLTKEGSNDRVYSDVYLTYDFVESLLFP